MGNRGVINKTSPAQQQQHTRCARAPQHMETSSMEVEKSPCVNVAHHSRQNKSAGPMIAVNQRSVTPFLRDLPGVLQQTSFACTAIAPPFVLHPYGITVTTFSTAKLHTTPVSRFPCHVRDTPRVSEGLPGACWHGSELSFYDGMRARIRTDDGECLARRGAGPTARMRSRTIAVQHFL